MRTFAEINLQALGENIAAYRQVLPEKTKIIAVVKANAYGHGMIQVSKKAIDCGVEVLAVAQPEEGIRLRENDITCPIIVMSGILPEEMEEIVKFNLIPFVYTPTQLRALEDFAEKADKISKFHLKIETGMNRVGILPGDELEQFISVLDECKYAKLSAICSHFANADELSKDFASIQYNRFIQGVKQIRQAEYYPDAHMANSAAAASCDFARLDYIRLGISMYGLQSEELHKIALKPVMSVKSKIIHVKTVTKDDTVGYSRSFKALSDIKVATIPLGYADGYNRLFSNSGHVLIGGKRVKVIGNVCMDQIMVDVTLIENVKTGDEVVIIGKQGNEEISAAQLAEELNTIHYEIVTGISERVKRIYVNE